MSRSRVHQMKCNTCSHTEHGRNPCKFCQCQQSRVRILRAVGKQFGLAGSDERRRLDMAIIMGKQTMYAEYGHFDKDLLWIAELPIVEIDIDRMEVI